MSARRRVLVAAGLAVILERALAHALVATDAAGHLLSAGLHSAIGIVAVLIVFLALRVVLVLVSPALLLLAVVESVSVLAARRLQRTASRGATMSLLLGLTFFAGGCSRDLAEFAGIWRVETHTRNTDDCEIEGPSVEDPPFVALTVDDVHDASQVMLHECAAASLLDCGPDGAAFIIRIPGGFLAQNSDAIQSGTTCRRRHFDGTVVLDDADVLRIEVARREETLEIAPDEECFIPRERRFEVPCASFDVFTARRARSR